MKKILFFITCTLVFTTNILAQDNQQPGNRKELIQKFIIARITNELNLTVNEAQQFWPVFNKYEADFKAAYKNNADDEIKLNKEIVRVQEKYQPDFLKILGDNKRVNQVYRTHKQIIEKLREKNNQRRMRPNAQRPMRVNNGNQLK
jgi:hypothetical protein